ncbi:MAG: hypothetical protein P8175_04095 [Deltaproteobacteria bacterium]
MNALLPEMVQKSRVRWSSASGDDWSGLRKSTLNYVTMNHRPNYGTGAYSYKISDGPALLYASCYAALIFHLYGHLDLLSPSERIKWLEHIHGYQCDDGLFRDCLIDIPLAAEAHWWGWHHLTLHAIMALTALGGRAEKQFEFLDKFKRRGAIIDWVQTREWKDNPAIVSNEVQNHATLLQYARDFQGQSWCADVLSELYDWFDRHQDPSTGLWGENFDSPELLSAGVQTGYHIWLLYFYDKRPIQYLERIIDSCLRTQNPLGGFGVALNSSACEDIDSIDPLVRLSLLTDYRKEEILKALQRALCWVLVNVNPDGGWVFRRGEAFHYGHDLMFSRLDESCMFPTWFRTLSLAYLAQTLPHSTASSFHWRFLKCPGLQFSSW